MPDNPTTVGGVRAVELSFRPLRDIASGRSVSFLSRTQLNTPSLGTLMPETYRPVADLFGQSQKLFPLELLQLADAIRTLSESSQIFEWISVDMPIRILRDRAAVGLLEKVCEQFSLSPNQFCFALPEKLLAETDSAVTENISRMRRRGYQVMLSGFGESGCRFLPLSELPVNYVLLSGVLTAYLGKSERGDQAVHSIVDFVNNLGAEPIADGVLNSVQAEAFYSFGCNYCAGPLSGDYLSLPELAE